MARRDYSRSLRWMREGTQRRRERRSMRKRKLALVAFCTLLLMVIGAPSFLCYTPVLHSLVASQAESYGWELTAKSVRIGWITPLHVGGVEALGKSGETVVLAESIDASVTLLDLLRGASSEITVDVDQPRIETRLYPGGSRLEDDLAPLLDQPSEGGSPQLAVQIRNGAFRITDLESNRTWQADQLQSQIHVAGQIAVEVEGLLTDPEGISGALQAKIDISTDSDLSTELTPWVAWQANANGLPLSLIELVNIRLPDTAQGMPQQWSGNASGVIAGTVGSEGELQVSAAPLDLRNLVVQDPSITGKSAWKIGQAVLQGAADWDGQRLNCRQLALQSDVGTAQFDGHIDLDALAGGKWLGTIFGELTSDFDLATFTQSTPGLIPVRTDARIETGRARVRLVGQLGPDQKYRNLLTFSTDAIQATVNGGRRAILQPIDAEVILRPNGNWVAAEHISLRGSFGEATASGDFQGGQAKFSLDFNDIAALLGSVLELTETTLAGKAEGNINWSVDANNRWGLKGTATSKNMVLQWPGGPQIRRAQMQMAMQAEGQWQGGALRRLDVASMEIREPNQQWSLALTRPVDAPDGNTKLPLRVTGKGPIDDLKVWFSHLLPENWSDPRGNLEVDVTGDFSLAASQINQAAITLTGASLVIDDRRYEQGTVKTNFKGTAAWPELTMRCENMTVSANALSLAAQGTIDTNSANLEVAYRCDLSRLQGAVSKPKSVLGGVLANTVSDSIDDAWTFQGMVEGKATILRDTHAPWRIASESTCKDLHVLQPPNVVYASAVDGPFRPTATNTRPKEIWAETLISLGADLEISPAVDGVRWSSLRLHTPWLTTDVAGELTMDAGGYQIDMKGPAQFNAEIVAQRVTSMVGEPIVAQGTHQTNLTVSIRGQGDSEPQVLATGSFGWDSAQVAGLAVGASTVPLEINETRIAVLPTTIPLGQGRINPHGDIHFRPDTLWFEQAPGVFAEGITLTPEMCRGWLKYMMPVVADATEVNGTFSIDLNECVVIPSDPARSRVRGTLQIEGASIGPGPLANNVISTIRSLEAAAKGIQGQTTPSTTDQQWLRMEPQAVDFTLTNGRVTHQRLMTRIGKVELLSNGVVTLDGQLGLGIQVPLRTEWLGNNLASLEGQQLTIPVQGTLQRPVVDTGAVTSVIANLGVTAARDSAETYLRKQLDKQLKKLIGN